MAIQDSEYDGLRGISQYYVRTFGREAARDAGLDVPAIELRLTNLLRNAGIETVGHDDPKTGSGQLVLEFHVQADLSWAACSLAVLDVVQSMRNSDLQLLARVWFGNATIFLAGTSSEVSSMMDDLLPQVADDFIEAHRKANS